MKISGKTCAILEVTGKYCHVGLLSYNKASSARTETSRRAKGKWLEREQTSADNFPVVTNCQKWFSCVVIVFSSEAMFISSRNVSGITYNLFGEEDPV